MNRHMSHRLANAAFRLSDAVAWVVLFFAVLGIFGSLLVEYVPPKTIPLTERLWGAGLSALVAAGAFHLTRRRVFGVLLVLLSPFAFEFYNNLLLVAAFSLAALAIFGAPFAIGYVEARNVHAGNAS